jgi:antitoxin ParD1/3/4
MSTSESDGISLTPEESAFVQNCLASGRYQSAKDVVQMGLRMLRKHEMSRQEEIAYLRRLVAEGAAQLDRGEGLQAETVFREVTERRERLQADQASSP